MFSSPSHTWGRTGRESPAHATTTTTNNNNDNNDNNK